VLVDHAQRPSVQPAPPPDLLHSLVPRVSEPYPGAAAVLADAPVPAVALHGRLMAAGSAGEPVERMDVAALTVLLTAGAAVLAPSHSTRIAMAREHAGDLLVRVVPESDYGNVSDDDANAAPGSKRRLPAAGGRRKRVAGSTAAVLRPWLRLDGGVRTSFARALLQHVLDVVLVRPGIPLPVLSGELAALGAADVADLAAALVRHGLLQTRSGALWPEVDGVATLSERFQRLCVLEGLNR
jgi:hypothetical protein